MFFSLWDDKLSSVILAVLVSDRDRDKRLVELEGGLLTKSIVNDVG